MTCTQAVILYQNKALSKKEKAKNQELRRREKVVASKREKVSHWFKIVFDGNILYIQTISFIYNVLNTIYKTIFVYTICFRHKQF